MKKKLKLTGRRIANLILLTAIWITANGCSNQTSENQPLIEKAKLLSEHGLMQDAKRELIDVIFYASENDQKAEAYFLLGNIAFEENDIMTALSIWSELSEKFPDSEHAVFIDDKIKELSEFAGDIITETTDNAVALSYIRHGDFWSRNKNDRLIIDASWLPKEDMAINWYDRIINEFPNTAASRLAYQYKMQTIMGWEDPGRFGSSFGIRRSFNKYMPLLLETFDSFESEHPEATTLQAFRYQIAQAYWGNRQWDKTREWLNLVIEKAGDGPSFYKDLAEYRLLKVEY